MTSQQAHSPQMIVLQSKITMSSSGCYRARRQCSASFLPVQVPWPAGTGHGSCRPASEVNCEPRHRGGRGLAAILNAAAAGGAGRRLGNPTRPRKAAHSVRARARPRAARPGQGRQHSGGVGDVGPGHHPAWSRATPGDLPCSRAQAPQPGQSHTAH
jgi:hypothetical protein